MRPAANRPIAAVPWYGVKRCVQGVAARVAAPFRSLLTDARAAACGQAAWPQRRDRARFPQLLDLLLLELLDAGELVAGALGGDEQLVELGVEGDVAAVGLLLALVLAVEDHLGEGDGEDREAGGQPVDPPGEGEPGRADEDEADLRERMGGDVGDFLGNPAAERLEAALSVWTYAYTPLRGAKAD